MRRMLVMVVAACLLAPTAALAQDIQSAAISVFIPGATDVSEIQAPVRFSGEITVMFRADAGTGCARLAGCAYHGAVVWKPSDALLFIVHYRRHGRRHTEADVFPGLDNHAGGSLYSTVDRAAADGTTGTCADEIQSGLNASGPLAAGAWTFPLSGALAATRCAGPLPTDVAAAVPRLALGKPGTVVHLLATRPFAGGGFAGTVTTAITARLGAFAPQSTSPAYPPGTRLEKMRTVTEAVQLVGIRGSLVAGLSGTSDPQLCQLLDSCGVSGSLTMTPALTGSSGSLQASAPVTRPTRDLLSALGAAAGGRSRGLAISGGVTWQGPGSLRAELSQGATCSDTVPLRADSVVLSVSGGRLHAVYYPFGAGIFGFEFGRTRCPGPELATAGPTLSGSVPSRVLSRRTFAITVRPSGSFQDDGYTIAPHGAITFTFRRGAITETVASQPAF